MKKTCIILFFSCALAAFPSQGRAASVDPEFNPNRIIEDHELLDYDSMDLDEIQRFLEKKGSYLATYQTKNAHGTVKSAAEIIYDASQNNYDCSGITLSDSPTEEEKAKKCRRITTINPKFLLVLLQKEASLIEDSNPSQARLDWATGYGCPDNWACDIYYKGFGKQVNSASLQFLAYMNESSRYPYQAGKTYTIKNTLDPYCTEENQTMQVTPENKATAALYDYTPHVFNGNYNVFRLFKRYFPKSTAKLYPDGSVLKAENSPAVYLIENGEKRPFLNYSAFASRYQPSQIITVSADELDKYDKGEAIRFANYSLVQTPDKTIYLLVDETKRPFESAAVFKKIGFRSEEIEQATAADLEAYRTGKLITATSTYVNGALLQDPKTGGIYYVIDDTKAPLTDKILLKVKFPGQTIIKTTSAELDKYTKIAPVLLDDGVLVKTDSHPSVYLISGGKKRPFATWEAFQSLGYNAANIITVSSKFLYNYDLGEAIQLPTPTDESSN